MQIAPPGVFAAPVAATDGTVELPADHRLDPVRGALEVTLADAARAGLPVSPLVDKVREGLAKGVHPAAIRDAAARLAAGQIEARQFVATHRPGDPPFPLLRAVALAREGGLGEAELEPLVAAPEESGTATRAVEVVTELGRRGYDVATAVVVVRTVATREPAAVGRVPAAVEAIRGAGIGGAAALAELRRRLAVDGGSFEAVVGRVMEDAAQAAKPVKPPAPATGTRKRRRRARRNAQPAGD